MYLAFLVILCGYLLGAIPTGYLVVRFLKGVDIRTIGSGSTGATNVLRACGKGPAIFVMAFDMFKGCVAIWLAIYLEPILFQASPSLLQLHLLAPLTALTCLIGHSRSIFLGFKGGKSAATALGTLVAMNCAVGILVFASWAAILWLTRIVSVASLAAGLLSILFMSCLGGYTSYVGYCVAGATCIFILHRANIERLLAGTEPKIGQKFNA
jgi:acyl phosphate:glycerol-3-phosphate acyltransferase